MIKVAAVILLSIFVPCQLLAQKRSPQSPQSPSKYERETEAENIKHHWGEGKLKAGDPAPDFNLKMLDSQQRVRLSSFIGKKPVALIFGTYT